MIAIVAVLVLAGIGVTAFAYLNHLGPFGTSATTSANDDDDSSKSKSRKSKKAINLNSLVSDKPSSIAFQLDTMAEGTIAGAPAFAPDDEASGLMSKTQKAFHGDSTKIRNLREDIREISPWCILLADDGSPLDASDVKGGTDPSMAGYATFRVLEKPTPEDIARVADETCAYDKIIIGQLGDDFLGYARTDDCIIAIEADEFEGVYGIEVACYRLDEVDNDDDLEDIFDDYYDDYEDWDFDEYYRQ